MAAGQAGQLQVINSILSSACARFFVCFRCGRRHSWRTCRNSTDSGVSNTSAIREIWKLCGDIQDVLMQNFSFLGHHQAKMRSCAPEHHRARSSQVISKRANACRRRDHNNFHVELRSQCTKFKRSHPGCICRHMCRVLFPRCTGSILGVSAVPELGKLFSHRALVDLHNFSTLCFVIGSSSLDPSPLQAFAKGVEETISVSLGLRNHQTVRQSVHHRQSSLWELSAPEGPILLLSLSFRSHSSSLHPCH